jgi:hypothetical protein
VAAKQSAQASRSVLWSRLLRWGFPLVSVGVVLLAQVVIPRILQLGLSEAAFTAYVAVTSVAGYVGFAESGLFASFVRELSALHGAQKRDEYAAEFRRARMAFAITPIIGMAIALAFLGSAVTAASSSWPEASEPRFLWASLAFLVATALSMGCGSYHSSIVYSTGRLLFGQVANLIQGTVPMVAVVITLVVAKDMILALWVLAGTTTVISVVRLVHATWLFRRESEGTKPAKAPTPLGTVVTAGLALRAAESLPQSAYPHLLTVLAAAVVPVVIPARTLGNGCRLISQQFVNLMNVHITRRLSGGDALRARGVREYGLAATFLSSLHLTLVGAIALIAEPVFRLWLPNQAGAVVAVLPGFLAEQALLSAALPCTTLFTAEGRLRSVGVIRLVGVVLGIVLLVFGLPHYPRVVFGYALALSQFPLFLSGMWFEARVFERIRTPPRVLAMRYGPSFLAAVLCFFYAQHPLPVAVALAIIGLSRLPTSMLAVWSALRKAPDEAAESTDEA